MRGEWAGLRRKGVTTVWAPASQDTSHVGRAGVGVVSAPPCLPFLLHSLNVFFFFEIGRAVRCMLSLGCGRFLHLVVLYGYQGADREAEKLALTDQLLDAAFGELRVVAREQPCLIVGGFNVEPTKIPCLAKGILKLLGVLLLVGSLGLPVSAHGTLLLCPEETYWWAAQRTPLWPASWLPVLDKSRGSKSAEVQRA